MPVRLSIIRAVDPYPNTPRSFHPNFHDHNSQIQRQMLEYMHTWVNGRRPTKDAVRNHQNVRLGSNQGGPAQGSQAQHVGIQAQHKIQGYANQIPGVQQATAIRRSYG